MHPQFSDNSKKITTFTVDKSSYQCMWALAPSNTWKDSRYWWKERKIKPSLSVVFWAMIRAHLHLKLYPCCHYHCHRQSHTTFTTTHYLLCIYNHTTLYKCLISVCANTHEHTLAAFYDPLFTMIQSSGRQLPKSGSSLHLVPAYKTSSTSIRRN